MLQIKRTNNSSLQTTLRGEEKGGVTGWRLTSSLNKNGTGPCEGYNCTKSEMVHLYYMELGNAANPLISGPFEYLVGYSLWSSTLFDDPPEVCGHSILASGARTRPG